MASLIDLPFEIIDKICQSLRNLYSDPKWSYLDFTPYSYWSPDDAAARTALVNLCLTCKSLMQVVRPHLYNHIRGRSRHHEVVTLAETFLDNQYLADLVQSIEIELDEEMVESERLLDYFAKQSLDPRWAVTAVKHPAQVVDLVLSSLRNLRTVSLIACLNSSEILEMVRCNHQGDANFLPNLREINVRHWDTENGAELDILLYLFTVTTPWRCSFRMCSGMREPEAFRISSDYSCPSLLEIRFTESALIGSDVRKIVECCPNLELFSYELGIDQMQHWGEYAHPSDITLALRPLQDTLRTLIMDFSGSDEVGDDCKSMSSLTGFQKLEHLALCFRTLSHCEIAGRNPPSDLGGTLVRAKHGCWTPFLEKLPSSMKSLLVLDAEVPEVLNHDIPRLAKVVDHQFPNLKKLVVGAQIGHTDLFMNTGIQYLELRREDRVVSEYTIEKIILAL